MKALLPSGETCTLRPVPATCGVPDTVTADAAGVTATAPAARTAAAKAPAAPLVTADMEVPLWVNVGAGIASGLARTRRDYVAWPARSEGHSAPIRPQMSGWV